MGNWVPNNLSNVKALSAGWNHNVALLSNGIVTAWGTNGANLGWYLTNVPPDLTNVAAVGAGALHSLALRNDGTVGAWGYNADGQTNVPPALSNVVAVAGGLAHSLALKADGTIVAWGGNANGQTNIPAGLANVRAISAGWDHNLAIRGGRLYPWITQQPQNKCAIAGDTVTFSASAYGLGSVRYQWQFNGTNISGATNSSLSLTNVHTTSEGSYGAVISNGAGSTNTQSATLNLSRFTWSDPSVRRLHYGDSLALSVQVTNATGCSLPLTYAWYLNGTKIGAGATTNYAVASVAAANDGIYSLWITNGVGATNNAWTVYVISEGSPVWWGNTSTQAWDSVNGLHDTIGLVAGGANHGLLVREAGTVVAWGTNDFGQSAVPAGLSNVTTVAAGDAHNLALKTDGTVLAWGRNDLGQTNVPSGLTNAVAISAAGHQSLALRRDGTVIQWGQTNAAPPNVTNVAAISSGTNFHLALLSNSTVVAWGANANGQTNVPASLSSVVAIATGGAHALALRSDGTIVAWGANGLGQTNVPANLTNAMAVAAGYAHSIALLNDGKLVAWGDNTSGQTNVPSWLGVVKLVAAGGNQTLVSMYSPDVQYNVDAAHDLLLICNTNSADSRFVRDYYLAHRPMAASANVLGIGYPPQETISRPDYTNAVRQPVLNWLSANPTKRPQYWILLLDG